MASAAFFFGSGIAFKAGAPGVDALTRALLDGSWREHTDRRFYPGPKDSASTGEAARAQEFLRRVKAQIDPRLKQTERREAHYEDLFAAARQIVQDETGELANPMIEGTAAAIRARTEDLGTGPYAHIADRPFASLADRATDLVQWVVATELGRVRQPVGIAVISDVAKKLRDVDIFTLNHECLIETQLQNEKIPFFDGFGDQQGEASVFNANWPAAGPAVRYFKLHGSTNWYLFRFADYDQYAKVIGDVDHVRDANGKFMDVLQRIPQFLTGTIVKEQSYGHGLVGELFTQFRARLSQHRTLICCGYGWGDKGINIRLHQWLRDQKANRIVILHGGDPNELAVTRFWYWKWEEYVAAGKVVVVPKWLCDCTAEDLAPYFDA